MAISLLNFIMKLLTDCEKLPITVSKSLPIYSYDTNPEVNRCPVPRWSSLAKRHHIASRTSNLPRPTRSKWRFAAARSASLSASTLPHVCTTCTGGGGGEGGGGYGIRAPDWQSRRPCPGVKLVYAFLIVPQTLCPLHLELMYSKDTVCMQGK